MLAVKNPRLIGAIALRSRSVARTENTPTIDASTPMARAATGKDEAERGVGADRADGREPAWAAAAVRTLPRTAGLIPMKRVRPDKKHPPTNASVRNSPDCANDSASLPFGSITLVDVTKTMAATGMTMMAIVLNCRRR